jgi:Ni/Fe-hydrogenase subunit HybB-like protein
MSSKYFGRELELPILCDMGRVLAVVLAIYGILRFEDLYHRGVLNLVFVAGYEQRFFLLEMFLSVIIPLALLMFPKVREHAQGLYLVAVLTLLGFVTNRLNVTITGVENAVGARYAPKWTEVVITAMFVALGFAIFGLAARYLPIFPEEKAHAPVLPKLEGVRAELAVPVHAGD